MSSPLTARPGLFVAAGILAALGTLSGCSGDEPGQPAPSGSDFLSSTEAPLAEDGLPPEFPRDDAPVVPGEVVFSEGDAASGFSATVIVSSTTPRDALAEAVDLLTATGWRLNKTLPPAGSDASELSASLSREGDELVILQAIDSLEDVDLTYFVRAAGA